MKLTSCDSAEEIPCSNCSISLFFFLNIMCKDLIGNPVAAEPESFCWCFEMFLPAKAVRLCCVVSTRPPLTTKTDVHVADLKADSVGKKQKTSAVFFEDFSPTGEVSFFTWCIYIFKPYQRCKYSYSTRRLYAVCQRQVYMVKARTFTRLYVR